MGNTITEAILGAWDDDEEAPVEPVGAAEPDATTAQSEVLDEAVPTEDEETEEEVSVDTGEEEEPEEEPEAEEPEEPSGDEEPEASFASEDPEVLSFLARHDGDVEQALKRGAFLEGAVGRQGRELGQLRTRVGQLEADLEQAALFSQSGQFFTAEQQQWLEEAVSSEQPLAYLQSAMNSGEFELARAVLEQGEFSAAQVVRLARGIDQAEERTQQATQVPAGVDLPDLFEFLQQHYPDIPRYAGEMTRTLTALGPEHIISLQARSQDPREAIQGIMGLYEIARAKATTVVSAREQVKTKRRQAADDVRRQAVVSSGQAAPPQSPSTRPRMVMPGLTWEALEAEFDTQ